MSGVTPEPMRRERRPQRGGAGPRIRATAASFVQDDLRQAILSMQILPGAALSEKELTARFGISRTPLREALIKLREEGLVEVFPQAGTFVARIPADAVPGAVFIRQALECATVERVAAVATPEIIAGLEAEIALQQEAATTADQDAFHRADESFHAALARAAGYPGVWKLAQLAKSQVDRCRRMTLPAPGRMAAVMREHRAIVEAISRCDGAAANAAMREHLGILLPDLLLLRERHPDYFV